MFYLKTEEQMFYIASKVNGNLPFVCPSKKIKSLAL